MESCHGLFAFPIIPFTPTEIISKFFPSHVHQYSVTTRPVIPFPVCPALHEPIFMQVNIFLQESASFTEPLTPKVQKYQLCPFILP